MRALTASDHLFLLLENQKQPMHIAAACLFEMPDKAPDDFLQKLVNEVRTGDALLLFPFNQVLFRQFFWKDEQNFRPDHHFRHIALPRPSDIPQLLEYISREHARLMDRQRPLWELHLIEGIAPADEQSPPRFAIYLKIHHAIADGVAAMRLLQNALSTSPNTRLSLPFWSLDTGQRHQIDTLVPKPKSIKTLLSHQIKSLPPVAYELGRRVIDRQKMGFTSVYQAPPSILNQKIRATRQVVAQSFDKARFEAIANYFHTTTNNIVLAVCAGALRRYLLEQNALPQAPLIAFVPVSLRQDNSKIGNQLSFLLANLGTDKAHPIDRLNNIVSSVADGKARFSRMNQTQIINYSAAIYGAAGLNLATGLEPTKQAFNLIISNVPGSDETLYLNGAKLTEIYPASVLFDGQAMNITLANRQHKIGFGITVCDVALPNIQGMIDFLTQALIELEDFLDNSTKIKNY